MFINRDVMGLEFIKDEIGGADGPAEHRSIDLVKLKPCMF